LSSTSFLQLFPSIVLPMFLAVIDQTIVASALPSIAGDLGGAERISWVVVGYLVATTITAPVYGRLGDVFGRRKLMLVALAVFAAGCTACALSSSIGMLTGARILQGAGGGGLMTLSQALVGEAIPPRERAYYQGYLATVAVTASAFGPVAGGFLTEHLGWRSIFLVNLPLAALAALLVIRLRSRPPSGEPFRFDFAGFGLFALFIASSLIALERGQAATGGSWTAVLVLLGLALVSLLLLLRQERRAPSPLLPLDLLRDPSIWRCDLMAACHGATLVSLITFMPLYYRIAFGASASEIGLLLLPLTVGIGIGSMTTGRMVGRTGRSAIFPSSGLLLVTALLILISFVSGSIGERTTSLLFGLCSLFMGTVMGVVQLTVQTSAGPTALGAGAATVQFSRSLGAAFGTAIVSTLLFLSLKGSGPAAGDAFLEAVQHGVGAIENLPGDEVARIVGAIELAFSRFFLCAAVFAGIGAVAAWTLPMRRV
jgi:EmrB/QacA subfamily drug resistance transporter